LWSDELGGGVDLEVEVFGQEAEVLGQGVEGLVVEVVHVGEGLVVEVVHVGEGLVVVGLLAVEEETYSHRFIINRIRNCSVD